jgi:hypothetical protein
MIPQKWSLVFKAIVFILYLGGIIGLGIGIDLMIDLILIRTM